MGGASKLSNLIGVIKDTASQSKAAVSASSFNLALLRSTTHDPFSPPSDKHLATVISLGNSSRATASAAIDTLMDRLQTTRNSAVALKCLFVIHRIIKNGCFILQDQLSVVPTTGGRNYLKLSNFRDQSSPINWELSSWVRWYGKYVETLLYTSRILGFFLGSPSSPLTDTKHEETVSSLVNSELIIETDSLVCFVEEISRCPESSHFIGNRLITGITHLIGDDLSSTMAEISLRIKEFRERLIYLSFSESVELVCALKRLENCHERLFPCEDHGVGYKFRRLVRQTKEMVSDRKVTGEEGKMVATTSRLGLSLSVRSGDPAVGWADPIRFCSRRFGSSEILVEVMDQTKSFDLRKTTQNSAAE